MRLIFVITLFLGVSACQSQPQTPEIIRTWRMVFELESHLASISPEKKALLDSLPPKQYQKVLEEVATQIQQNTFTFYKNQTYQLLLKGGEITQKGTWQIKNRNKLLLWQEKKGEKDKYSELDIERLEKDTLVVIAKQENGKMLRTVFVGS